VRLGDGARLIGAAAQLERAGRDDPTAVELLDLSHNEISILSGLESFIGLRELSLAHNTLGAPQSSRVHPRSARTLARSRTTAVVLRCLPAHLVRLDVSNNNLVHLVGLEHLTMLEELNVCHNQLEDLSGLLGTLALRRLAASHNRISKIDGLEHLTELEVCVARWPWDFGSQAEPPSSLAITMPHPLRAGSTSATIASCTRTTCAPCPSTPS